MRCVTCGTELLSGKKFCHACGTPVGLVCRGCGSKLEAGFRFCPDCGLALAATEVHDTPPPAADDPLERLSRHIPETLAQKIRAAQGAIEGERKLVTVLFCDLVGSTAIAEKLDPEEYHDLLEQYLELTFREIYRFEGIVNRIAGDGLMALFGAPVAHEDAPQRAIRAALAIREALARLNASVNVELRARIGIHSGPVVVGTVGNDLKMDYTAIGDTTNLASRLESTATPGTIVVSEATTRLVRGFFEVRPTGPLTVKGKSEPVVAYEVLGESSIVTPMAIAAERGLTPLVGRAEELAQLEACYRRLESSQAQVVAVVGDAGSGKSRLLYEFKQQRAGETVVFFEGRCAALGQSVPYFPFVNMLRNYFGFAQGDSAAARRAKVTAKLGKEAEQAEKAYPLLTRLLAAPVESAAEMKPEEIKREVFDVFAHLLLPECEGVRVVVMIEDLHWVDDPSRDLLERLVARLVGAGVLVIVTHRPDDRAIWRSRAPLTQLVLRRLSDDEVRTMVCAVAGGPLPHDLERLLVAKAEGSPFCAEEITRSLFEEGYLARNGGVHLTRPVDEIRIPGTVQEVIAARLDRLTPQAKRVVQVSAVLGRQFHRDQLAQLLDGDGIDVAAELADLEQRGIFHRKSLVANDEYRFGESLTQEVAYDSLLLRQRRQLHERVALMIEGMAGDGNAERSALLAHHFARSDNRAKAIEALLRAGLEAEALPSYRAAVDYFGRAWELADAPDAAGAFRRETLSATSGISRLCALFGASPLVDAERASRRGRELAAEIDDTETLAMLCYCHGVITMMGEGGHFARGLALAEEGLAIAERAGHRLMATRLSRGLAVSYANDGRFELAQRAIRWVMDEIERGNHHQLSDISISTRWVGDVILYLSDDLDAALAHALETHALASRAPNRTVTSGAASTVASISFLRGDYAEARRWADESLEIAEAISNVASYPGTAALALAARFELGEVGATDHYVELIEQGIASGATVQIHVRFLADALRAIDDLTIIARFAEQLRTCPVGGRLRESSAAVTLADLWRRLGRHEESERAFGLAIGLAEAIGSRSVLTAALVGAAELATDRGDRATAGRFLARAVDICQALRLEHYLRRARKIAERPEARASVRA